MTRQQTDFWRIDNGDEQLPLDSHPGPETTHAPGESRTVTAWLSSQSDPPDANPDGWPGREERWRTLRAYQARQGQFATGEPMGGSIWYSETHDSNVPAGSLLIALRPPTTTSRTIGLWALVESVETKRALDDLYVADMEVTCLAPLGEYADHAAVRTALERPGIGLF